MGVFRSRPLRRSATPKGAWDPATWASRVPFRKLDNFGEVFRAAWENRDRLGYAWRILNEGVCDGCALGTHGMRDWTVDGVHLCNVRLRLLRLNTIAELDPALLEPTPPRSAACAVVRCGRWVGSPSLCGGGAASRLPTDRLGRGARTRRRAHPRHDARPDLPLPDEPRDPERDLLRGPEGDARDRDEQRRQRRARLPRAEHRRPEAVAGRRGHDLLLRRPDRQRGRHLHRLEPRQEPAGADEVPLPREEGRDTGRRRQPLPRARHGRLLGPLRPRERRLRDQDRRRRSCRSPRAATAPSSAGR
jgi:hypothetical protein